MSNGRGRGLVFFGLIAFVVLIAGFAIWRLRKSSGGGSGDDDFASAGSARGGRLIKGTGTSWREEDEAAEASGVIEGVVYDGNGKPVDGATVTLGRARGRNEDANAAYAYMQPRGIAISAGGGRFRIERLVPGEYAAAAMHESWAPGQRAPIEVKEKETARIELKLGPGGLRLAGRVTEIEGGAVAGAKVTAAGRSTGSSRAPTLFYVVADGEGRYRMTLERGNYGLRVEAGGYASANEGVFVARATTKDVRLVPAARVSGRVVERGSKRPVPDAEVSLTSGVRFDFKPPRDEKADSEGQFMFKGLEPGTYEVMARKGALIGAGQLVAVAVAQVVEGLEIEVDRGYTVSGRVKDERGGGVANIRVYASRDTPPFGQAARTRSNPDGTYALEGLLPGSYRLSASDENVGGAGRMAVKVLAADVPNIDITLPESVKVTGRVTTSDGKPVEGARIQARIEATVAGGMTMMGDMAGTAADGTFELRRASPGKLSLTARHDELGFESWGPEEVKPGDRKVLALVLKKGGAVSGTVKFDDGQPAPDIRVAVMVRDARMFVDARDITAPDGRYRITGVPAGRLSVVADASGRGNYGGVDREHQQRIELADGEEKAGVDLVVSRGVTIRGSAVSREGKPVAGAIITAGVEMGGRAFRMGGSRDLKSYSSLEGQFTLENMSKGTYTLWASHPDFPDAELKGVTAGSNGVRLQFPAASGISGVVVRPDGKPAPHYTLTVLPGPTSPDEKPEDRRRRQGNVFEAPSHNIQNPSGAFELKRLAAGSHELAVATAAGETATQVVAIQAGERKTGVRIQVEPGFRVTGKVLEHGTNKPIPGVTVSVSGTGGARMNGTVSEDGTFIVENAPRGDNVRLFASGDMSRHISESKELQVKPSDTSIDAGTIKLLPGNYRDRMSGDPADRAQAGTFLRVENGRAIVGSVIPDGPAQKAGLNKGDHVLAISKDGNPAQMLPTAELGNGALMYLMQGKPADKVILSVESAGSAARTVTLTLEPYKPRPPGGN